MIIGSKTMGYPVPGLQFDNHKLFMEILPSDTEETMIELVKFVEEKMKMSVKFDPTIRYTKVANLNGLNPVILEKG